MKNKIIVRFSELTLKGKNRNSFVFSLIKNIRYRFDEKNLIYSIDRQYDQLIITPTKFSKEYISILKIISGISWFSLMKEFNPEFEEIKAIITSFYKTNKFKKFRLSVKLNKNKYYLDKMDLINKISGWILNNFDTMVDLENYDVDLNFNIKSDTEAYFYSEKIQGLTGLPAGSNGKSLNLLSGGIDSPVASIETIRRGINSSFITFLTPTTSSENTINKILELAETVDKYNGKSQTIFLVNFVRVQNEIMKLKEKNYRIILLRRFFLEFANLICSKYHYDFIVTGDSMGQVASQTPTSLYVINEKSEKIVIRPLITDNKEYIINKAKEYETYEISIREGDDMCSMFTPSNPITVPKLAKTKELEDSMKNMDEILEIVLTQDTRIIKLGKQNE